MITADEYTPRGRTADILDRAYDLVRSVPYQVSARWLFYRLLQEGYYGAKSDYGDKFLKAMASARRAFYKQWRPDTLADETREAIERGRGYGSLADMLGAYSRGLGCNLDKWQGQACYLELWFEARAMAQQFEHYTQHITLRPMGGQPSIPYKWRAAKDLERAAADYGAPIVVLFFGDLDPAGETIAEVVERDVRAWSEVDFEFMRCGLNLEQVQRYQVPENPEKPGQYQWEAVSDTGAREIITSHVGRYLRQDAFGAIEQREAVGTHWLRGKLAELQAQALAWNGSD